MMDSSSKYDGLSAEELRKLLIERDETIEGMEATIYVLRHEKDQMAEDFRSATHTLIEKLKSETEQRTGMRPQTAQLLSNHSMSLASSNLSKKSWSTQAEGEPMPKKTACHNCGKKVDEQKLKKHMVTCFRWSPVDLGRLSNARHAENSCFKLKPRITWPPFEIRKPSVWPQ